MRINFVICVFCLSVSVLHSQKLPERNFVFSLGAGSTYMFGDFPANRAKYAFLKQNVVFGADARKYIADGVNCGADIFYFTCNGASDMTSRNYQFQSKLFSVVGIGSMDLISFFEKKSKTVDLTVSVNSGIIHASVPFMAFPPNTGRPDGTDKLKTQCFGVLYGGGLGCRVNLTTRVGLRLEATYNFTTTDFLDGFSPQDSKRNDSYIQGILEMFFRLPAHKDSKQRQPRP
ncbi:MAG: hypothetical protein H6Q17_261 [Bacteroidetes bacterium]|nr:hypothetical protein [Bacteroidota bacterium]